MHFFQATLQNVHFLIKITNIFKKLFFNLIKFFVIFTSAGQQGHEKTPLTIGLCLSENKDSWRGNWALKTQAELHKHTLQKSWQICLQRWKSDELAHSQLHRYRLTENARSQSCRRTAKHSTVTWQLLSWGTHHPTTTSILFSFGILLWRLNGHVYFYLTLMPASNFYPFNTLVDQNVHTQNLPLKNLFPPFFT